MLTRARSHLVALFVSLLGVGIAVISGFMAGTNPTLLGLGFAIVPIVTFFFVQFEVAVIGLLVLRSALDPFSGMQLPAAFAIGVSALTLLYVVVQLITRKPVITEKLWWIFATWVALQSLWLVLMFLGGLGSDGSEIQTSLREWVRIFSWLMVYLLVLQLKDKVHPNQIVSKLFLALIFPSTIAFLQIFAPSLLPPIFIGGGGDEFGAIEASVSRVNGTLGHPNTFATFLLLFIGLTLWKLGKAKQRLYWLCLLGLLAFFYVATKALFALAMLGVFLLVFIAPKLSLPKLIGGALLFAIAIALFGSTEFGQQRLASLASTPLFNSNIDVSRAILLSASDGNSFNWRIAQWTFLLQAWEQHPILGYGLATCKQLTVFNAYAHNDYVRALAEGGIVGFAIFILLFIALFIYLLQIFRTAQPNSKQRNLCLVLLAMLSAIMVGMLTENIWSHTTLYFYLWTLISLAGWEWDERRGGFT
ncbi:O-antigen polymerase [Calothrix sp. NIES-4071]|nr:O-antigen polymerase [Calothrix sp. NIES-4071]BAZ56373.1 O-antigen polymerase [Calothrix sp. NIES-4105]